MTTIENDLAGIGNLSAPYAHYPKRITPGADLRLPAAHLKWLGPR